VSVFTRFSLRYLDIVTDVLHVIPINKQKQNNKEERC